MKCFFSLLICPGEMKIMSYSGVSLCESFFSFQFLFCFELAFVTE